ncbi:MAG: hypothetical protein L6V85_07435 [Clostridiales bacterium]|nr:MAG: hypothetical protein L6V85_07435 [Clostridiales bacterium]
MKELNIVAQDITRYGIDLYNEYALLKLLDKITSLDVEWVRLLYCYPELFKRRPYKIYRKKRQNLQIC